jgi:hypothetical protein
MDSPGGIEMPETARDVFLGLSRELNGNLRALAAAMENGPPPTALVERSRAEAEAALGRLRSLAPAEAGLREDIAKVANHLDLFLTLADSIGAVPALSRKLLAHLLEEQIEITAGAAAASPSVGLAPASVRGGGAAPAALPGGRRPLTVGSLIGR